MLYVLLPATIAVWATIIIRVYGTLHPDDVPANIKRAADVTPVAQDNDKDTFSIVNNYRDPFGERPVAQRHATSESAIGKVIKNITPEPAKKENTWPSIHYSGMIKNQKSNRQLAMLEINGSQRAMKSGDVSDNVKVCRIFKDSIEVMYEKQKRFFKK
ncbi:MAG: hypothetical protein JWO44_1641 [Bacteroidetes bacterium]|nr:hypothetical protein [Bacteroidota bacterium]